MLPAILYTETERVAGRPADVAGWVRTMAVLHGVSAAPESIDDCAVSRLCDD